MFRFIWTIKCVEHTTVPGGDTLSCSRPAQEWTAWILVVNIMYISILLSKPQILFVTFFRVYCWYLPVYNSRGLHYRFLFIHGCLFYCYIKQPEISFSFLLSFFLNVLKHLMLHVHVYCQLSLSKIQKYLDIYRDI